MTDILVSGSFDVQLSPVSIDHAPFPGMMIAKRFEGAIDGSSTGMMLMERTATEGSAGYVAMERVTGTLAGRSGSFVLQHSSTMDRGAQAQSITVVPDSGTDGLAGLTGRMVIRIENGQHFYDFTYRLPAG